MTIASENMTPDLGSLDEIQKYVGGRDGKIDFRIADMQGTAEMKGGLRRIEYVQSGARLASLPVDLPLPESMLETRGNIAAEIIGDKMSFVFKADDWTFSAGDDAGFSISHKSARRLLSALTGRTELPFIRADIPAAAAGKYANPVVSNLRIMIGDMIFSGSIAAGGLTVAGAVLDLDQVLDELWFQNYADNQYLSGDPLLAPFDFGADVAITADEVKLNGTVYSGFVYSLAGPSQKMSISDSENGRLLLSITKDRSKYAYLAQMSKFFVAGKVFGKASPLNMENTTITAEASMESYGLTAYDIRRNMAGIIDAAFDGGVLTGLGTDDFYNSANRIGKADADQALNAALGGGRTDVKEMQVTGEYQGGDFRTTKPFLLTARHVDATGNIQIKNDQAAIRANLILRGTSPVPKPVALYINGRGRSYSLSEILRDLDLDYLREFVAAHMKF
jgi:hypothetical protein